MSGKAFLAAAALTVAAWPSAQVAAAPLALAANQFSDDVTIADAALNQALGPLSIGTSPADVIVSHASRFAYVALAGAASDASLDTVAVIDIAAQVVLSEATVGDHPVSLALSADGRRLFVANAGRPNVSDGTLTILDARAARGLTPTAPVLATVPLGGDPGGVAVTPDGRFAYVTNTRFVPDNVVFIVDVDIALSDPESAVVGSIEVGNGPLGIAVTEDGRIAYVANSAFGSNGLSVVDLEARMVSRTIAVGSRPTDVAISPDGRYVWVANLISGSVSVIARETDRVRQTVTVGSAPSGIGFRSDGRFAWVANRQSLTTPAPGTLSVVDTRLAISAPDEAVVATVEAGDNPASVAVAACPSEALVEALFARIPPEDADENLDDRVSAADLLAVPIL